MTHGKAPKRVQCPECWTVFRARGRRLYECPKCGWHVDRNRPRRRGVEVQPGLYVNPGGGQGVKATPLDDPYELEEKP